MVISHFLDCESIYFVWLLFLSPCYLRDNFINNQICFSVPIMRTMLRMPPRDLYIRYSDAQQRDCCLFLFKKQQNKNVVYYRKITELVKELNETKINILFFHIPFFMVASVVEFFMGVFFCLFVAFFVSEVISWRKLQCSSTSKHCKNYLLCVNDLICLQLYFYIFYKNIRSFVSTSWQDSCWVKSYASVTKMPSHTFIFLRIEMLIFQFL